MEQQVLNVVGYCFSGSSAVIDYLREFDKVKFVETEIHLFTMNGGLEELESKFKLNNPYLVGLAIERFARSAKILAEAGVYGDALDNKKLWNGYFFKRTMEFIEEISFGYNYIYSAYNLVDKREKNILMNFRVFPRIKYWIFKYIFRKKNSTMDTFRCYKDKIYICKDFSKFKKAKTKYINDLLNKLKENYNIKDEILVLDQFFPVALLDKKNLYFNELKTIIVDRDPRDIYILNCEKLKLEFIPQKVECFIEWFKMFRKNKILNEKQKDCLAFYFEDLIYKQTETKKKIDNFLGLNEENHINPKKYFNPEVSIKNTQLFKRYFKYKKEIKIIEKELKEYCYNFPEIEIPRGKIF